MKTITSFGLLSEARKYTNRSVVRALVEIADKIENYGSIVGEKPSQGYEDFRFFVENESVENAITDIYKENTEFISLTDFALRVSKVSGREVTEDVVIEELCSAFILIPDEDSDECKPIGISLEAIDKGWMIEKKGKYYISSRGMVEYWGFIKNPATGNIYRK